MKTRWISAAAAAVLMSVGITGITSHANATPNNDAPNNFSGIDQTKAIVQLVGDPVATSVKTRPAKGKKIDWSGTNVRAYRAALSAERNDFKKWLQVNAPKAKVTSEFDISLNAVGIDLNGTTLATLRTAPLVANAAFEATYTPTVADPDLSLISAQAAWANQAGGAATAGDGIKVGVLDTGIDLTHPCFSDAGYPAQTQLGDVRFTNNKVIVARVFNNNLPKFNYTPLAVQEHGTHVAGTIGCDFNTPATVDGVAIPFGISGVAPRALLGNYNIFPSQVQNARSEDILNALDAAVADGMDVLNMSLGGGSHGIQDLVTVAVDNIDAGANVIVAIAAGNSGPGHDTVESPGMAARALTAGAATVNHFVGATLSFAGGPAPIASGDFPTVSADLTAPLGVVTGTIGGLGNACAALPAGSLTGKIGVASRGTCTFSAKLRNLQAAGAIAGIIVNNVAGDPTAMATDGAASQPTIPAYMAGIAARAALAAADGAAGTISATLSYQLTTSADIMAGFSSQGPTDVDRRVKPDVVAPGVNVLSSIPRSFCGGNPCFAFFSGTSMATPHLAGSAAIVRQQHPTWTAAQVRSAIVNTADQGTLTAFTNGTTVLTDPQIIGAGRENLSSAVRATVLLDPVSVSFGTIPSGSGQSRNSTITITNTSGHALTAAVTGDTAHFGTSTIPAGATATITVSGSAVKGQAPGQYSAMLRISDGGTEVAHAVLFYEVS